MSVSIPLRWRLTLWYSGISLIIILGFVAALYWNLQRTLLKRLDLDLTEELEEIVVELRLSGTANDLQQVLAPRFYVHSGVGFLVRDAQLQPLFKGEPLQHRDLKELEPVTSGYSEDVTFGNLDEQGAGAARVASRWITSASRPLLVQVIQPTQRDQRELQMVANGVLTALPFTIGAAVVGGYVLARKALMPVDKMAQTASMISAQQLSARIPVQHHDEIGALAKAFNAMLDRLQRAVDELRSFTADAAHELRTPLTVMQTETEVALRRPRSPDEYQQILQVTLGESRRLATLTDRLLMLAQHDHFSTPYLPHDEVYLDAIVADAMEQVRSGCGEREIRLESYLSVDATVRGDEVQLRQLVANLLDNAVKFSKPKGCVHVRLVQVVNHWCMTIQDQGVGIAPQDLPYICRRFYRTERSRLNGIDGMGLGLAISKAIVESHLGMMTIESQPDVGTKVTVTLPAYAS